MPEEGFHFSVALLYGPVQSSHALLCFQQKISGNTDRERNMMVKVRHDYEFKKCSQNESLARNAVGKGEAVETDHFRCALEITPNKRKGCP